MSKESKRKHKLRERVKLEEVDLDSSTVVHKIHCPDCSTIVPMNNLNIQTNIAKCNSCNGIFSIRELVNHIADAKHITQEVLKPEGIEIFTFKDELDISVAQRWQQVEGLIAMLFPFIVFSVAILVSVFVLPEHMRIVGVLALLTVSFASYISYFLARKKHKTNIHVNKQYLHIEQRPKKFVKDKIYKVEDIDQIYIKAGPHMSGTKGGSVHMIVNTPEGQKHVLLLGTMNSLSKAKYVEQEIEKHLGITNKRVPDEYG